MLALYLTFTLVPYLSRASNTDYNQENFSDQKFLLSDGERNLKRPSTQRWRYPIYNGTLETLI